MKIFYKRPLSFILCIMLGAFVLSPNLDFGISAFLSLLSLLAVILTFVPINIFGKFKTFVRILSLGLCLIIAYSTIFFGLYMKADERFKDETVTIEGKVEEIDKTKSIYYDYVVIKSTKVNDAAFSNYNFEIYIDKEFGNTLTDGTPIRIVGKIEKPFTYAQGINGTISEIDELKITGTPNPSLINRITTLRKSITRSIVLASKHSEGGGFLAALLLGDDSYLSPTLERDFMRMGITHILALSGMHLAIMSAAVNLIFSFIGLGKKSRTIFTAIFTFIYMCITGFPSSVTRAGIMLIMSSILFLIMGARDSITSLTVSACIICFFDPISIYDIGLWLSVFATLGVIVAYEIYYEYVKERSILYRLI